MPSLQTYTKALNRAAESGAALIVVIAFLALITALVLTFFSSVTTEHSSSKGYADSVTTMQLADSALHYVMGTIREATSKGSNIAWASQPGMIRTYGANGNTASGAALQHYKLYSAASMVGSGNFDPATDRDPAWRNKTALWTDLNSPAIRTSGTARFPILSGNSITRLTRNAAGATVPEYLGYDSNRDGYPDIDGFSIDPASVTFDSAKPLSADNNPVPMPVRWIYVLRDGSFTVPDSIDANGKTARWTGTGKPSKTNPVVGRIAFWTDDETAKLNLNTAGEGSYWDNVTFATQTDLAFGRNGPAQREYSRYPGHPAGASLSPVLGTMLGLPEPSRFCLQPTMGNACATNGQATFTPDLAFAPGVESYLTRLFQLTPRFAWGGSKQGAVATAASITGAAGISAADLRLDRLYASVDEALFAVPAPTDSARPLNPPGASPGLSAADIEKARFFLTTNSRTPEVNPFNQPKITIWPIDDPSKANPSNDYNASLADSRSPIDQLIGFCSTINGQPYYFTRNDPFDPAGDFTPRNAALYDYLVDRLSQPLPGYGSSFRDRYPGSQTPQLVTGFYDFIRGAINLCNSTESSPRYAYSFCKPYSTGGSMTVTDNLRPQFGQVAPFRHPSNGTKGIGRFPTIQQAVLLFIATAANQPPLQTGNDGKPLGKVPNPLHPWPGNLPAATNITGTTNSGGATIYRFGNAAALPYPTLYLQSGSWHAAPKTLSGTVSLPPNSYAQTHSGLRFLTEQNPETGAFDLPNRRYRGPDLGFGQTQMQAVLLFNMATPAAGNPALAAHYKLRVSGAEAFRAAGSPLNMRNGTKEMRSDQCRGSEFGASAVLGFRSQLHKRTTANAGASFSVSPLVFHSDPVVVSNQTTSATFGFQGGEITVEILNPVDDSVVQTAKIVFPDADFPTPVLPGYPPPVGPYLTSSGSAVAYPSKPEELIPSSMLTLDHTSPLATTPNFNVGTNGGSGGSTYFNGNTRLVPGYVSSDDSVNFLGRTASTSDYRYKLTCDTVRAVELAYGDIRLASCLQTIPAEFFVPHRHYFDPEMPSAHSLLLPSNVANASLGLSTYRGATLEGITDFFLNKPSQQNIDNITFDRRDFGLPSNTSVPDKFRALLSGLPSGNTYLATRFPSVTSSATFGLGSGEYANLWPALTYFPDLWKISGDFDNSIINNTDGPFINKPEEGMSPAINSGENPYFGNGNRYFMVGDSIYSPNRQVASPVVFGSLPAGVDPGNPNPNQAYRTLLFSPNPNAQNHPALGKNPPDHALLDFFHMPVVEPYAVSEPFSTGGKVNMNYRLAPFSFIKRETAIRGVLRGVNLTAVPDRWMRFYKDPTQLANNARVGADGQPLNASASGYNSFRFPICEDDTLREFEHRFDQNDLFRSPSEICSLWLYPAVQPTRSTAAEGQRSLLNPGTAESSTHSAIKQWWYGGAGGDRKSLTGDNMRERPYYLLYPRLTTKSNTYTVHVRVQSLAKISADPDQASFKEGADQVTGEFRGSFSIERYVDPSDPTIPDFAANREETLDAHYRFRVLSSKRFVP